MWDWGNGYMLYRGVNLPHEWGLLFPRGGDPTYAFRSIPGSVLP